MPIVPRASVRMNLILAILVTIVLSWVLSTGIANYFNYLNFRSLHQEMIMHPEAYPRPIQEPRFSILDFIIGRPPFPRGGKHGPPPEMGGRHSGRGSRFGRPGKMPPPPYPMPFEIRWMILRLLVALGLAALAGVWLGKRFTKPLMQLAEGADAFQSGNFKYRIPTSGKNEFSAVASAMNEMAQQVSEHINKLEEDAQRRRQFLADIAHEFRSPVTTMLTMAGALNDGIAEEPERKEVAVSALVHTSERLLRLVKDLMEFARLDIDELPLHLRQVDICDLVRSAISLLNTEANNSNIALHQLEPDLSVKANVDPDRIIQILDNVIGNAISYAGAGAEVNVAVEDGEFVRITICDTGKGIKEKDMPYVLDPFYRADAARTPGDSHSGLGLSIARKLAEMHGGNLNIQSKEDGGTTVVITLPKKHD